MKKLLVLMLVFGLASIANAHLIFTVNGLPQPEEIMLDVCQTIELDLELSGPGYPYPDDYPEHLQPENITSYKITYLLSNDKAEFITNGTQRPELGELSDIEFPTAFDFSGKVSAQELGLVTISAGQFVSGPVEGYAVLMNELYVHCLELGDVILEVWAEAGTIINGEPVVGLLHTLTIHQIPEPATMALLGLGGLLLLRRRK